MGVPLYVTEPRLAAFFARLATIAAAVTEGKPSVLLFMGAARPELKAARPYTKYKHGTPDCNGVCCHVP